MAAIHLRRFVGTEEFRKAFLQTLQEELQRTSSSPAAVIIPGGRTPLPVFDAIVRKPFQIATAAHIIYTDDRHVPEDSPESNYGASRPMLRTLQIPPERTIRVHTELPLAAAAERYHMDLKSFLEAGGRIGVAFLGLGPDGHTCSLFSQADLDRGRNRYAVAVERPSGPHRVSVTPALLEETKRVILLAAGSDKHAVADQLLRDPASVIAGRAVTGCANVELWIA